MKKRKLKKYQLGAVGVPPSNIWGQTNPLLDEFQRQNLNSANEINPVMNMDPNQNTRDTISTNNPYIANNEPLGESSRGKFEFNPKAYAKLQGLNSIASGLGNLYQDNQLNNSRINNSPLSGLQFSNGRSNQSKYGYSYQAGGVFQRNSIDPGHQEILNNGYPASIPLNRYETEDVNDPLYNKLQDANNRGIANDYNKFTQLTFDYKKDFIEKNKNNFIDDLRSSIADEKAPSVKNVGSESEISTLSTHGFKIGNAFSNVPTNKLNNMLNSVGTVTSDDSFYGKYFDYDNTPFQHKLYNADRLNWKDSNRMYTGVVYPYLDLPTPMLRHSPRTKRSKNLTNLIVDKFRSKDFKNNINGIPTRQNTGEATLRFNDDSKILDKNNTISNLENTPFTKLKNYTPSIVGDFIPNQKDEANLDFSYDEKNDQSISPTVRNSFNRIDANNISTDSYKPNIQGAQLQNPVYRNQSTLGRLGVSEINEPRNITGVPTTLSTIQTQISQNSTHPIEVYDKRGKFLRNEFIGNKSGVVDHNYIGNHRYAPRGGNSYIDTSYQVGGLIDDDVKRGMMKGKIATEAHFGNPSAIRMTKSITNPYVFDGSELGWDGIPVDAKGSYGTHFMGSYGNQVRPSIQEVNGKLQYIQNPSGNSKENMNFNTDDEAEYFAEHYKDVAPMMKFKDGGQAMSAKQQLMAKCYKKGGEVQNPPKVYTDLNKFKKAQKMYNDSLNLYNSGEDYYNRLKQMSFDTKGIGVSEENLKKARDENYKKYPWDKLNMPVSNYKSGNKFQPSSKYNIYVSDIGNIESNRYKKPVQPVVYQPEGIITSPQTVSSQHGKNGIWGDNYDKKHPPIYVTNPKDPRIGQYGIDGNQYLYKGPIHPIQKMPRINPQQMDLNSKVNIQGQQVPIPQFKFPQQKGNPVYGPGNTIIGYSDNLNFKPAYEYTGAPNNEHNLQDKALLENPDSLKKYVSKFEPYKFKDGGSYFGDEDLDYLWDNEDEDNATDVSNLDRTTVEEAEEETRKKSFDYNNDKFGIFTPRTRRLLSNQNDYQLQGLNYDDNLDNTYVTPSNNLSLDNQQNQVYQHLQSKGLTKEAIAGIMSNVQHESNFNSGITGDNGTSFGLFQHHAERKNNLLSYLRERGLPANSVQGQIDFALQEKPNIIKQVNQAKTPQQAADIWVRKFEVPANVNKQSQLRQKSSLNFYQQGGTKFNFPKFDPILIQQNPIVDRGNFSNVPYTQSQQNILSNVKRTERELNVNQLKQEQSARSSIEKGTKFQLPNGQNKLYKDMTIKEKGYVQGQSLRNKGRWNENSVDQPLLNSLNPVSFLYDMSAGIGEAPLMSDVTHSVMPYVTGIGAPLAVGALAGMGSKTTGQFVNNLVNPLAGTGDLVNNLGNKYLPNTYKLNPFAFKPNPEAFYRQVGKSAYDDAITKGKVFSNGQEDMLERVPGLNYLDEYNKSIALDKAGKFNLTKPLEAPFVQKGELFFPITRKPTGKGYKGTKYSDAEYLLEGKLPNEAVLPRYQQKYFPTLKESSNVGVIRPEFNELNNFNVYKRDWLKGYKEIPKPKTNFNNYLTQEEAVQARAERMLSQKNKWVGQPEDLTYKFENAVKNHNPTSDYSPVKLGHNTGSSTEISKLANLTNANKSRIAAHETGHYYKPLRAEGDEWNNSFNWGNLKGNTPTSTQRDIRMAKEYLSGKGYYKNRSSQYGDEIRERAAQLKDYIAQKNNIPLNKNFEITEKQLDDAIKNYVKDTGLNNNMSTMLSALKDKKSFLKNMNKYALGTLPIIMGAGALQKKQLGGNINDNNGYLLSNLHNFTPKKIINSNHITTEGMAFPIQANGVKLYPNTGDYIFPTKKVVEKPLYQQGGTYYVSNADLANLKQKKIKFRYV